MIGSEVARGDGFTVRSVSCPGGDTRWSAPEPGDRHGMVLVRSGLFRLRERGREMLAEPATAYLELPGVEAEFAHPAGGDVCTAVHVSPALWHELLPATWPADDLAGPVPVDGTLELAHLDLLRATRSGDVPYAVTERLLHLVAVAMHSALRRRDRAVRRILGPSAAGSGARATPGAGSATRAGRTSPSGPAAARLAGAAAEAIVTGDPAAVSLTALARRLAVSPYHLSRIFHDETGRSITRYRNRVRVSRALHRLAEGHADLAGLAVELGFADQAHLSRVIKAETGQTPGVLRRALAGPVPR